MGKKTGIFTEGQLVYAKVKGYSPWPAKIIKVLGKHKYGVYFYGTGETGNCKSEDLDAYDDRNRQRFNTDRQMKKQEYKEAVEQIESAKSGNDPAPFLADDNPEIGTMPLDATNDTFGNDTTNDISSRDADEFDAEESQLQIAEEVPKSTPAPSRKRPAASKPLYIPQTPEPIHNETKEGDEKVSRSGRKIKEKKINNDEMDPDEVFTQSRKRSKIDDSRTKTAATVSNDSSINEFVISKMHILNDPERKQFLTMQYEMVQTILDIKQALGLETVEIDRALTACKNFRDKVLPNITSLMLLKYSSTVSTIKRLRNYIGNLELWKLDEETLKSFEQKAKLIREIASEIYDSFKVLFPSAPEDASFIEFFTEEYSQFLDKYNKLDSGELFEALTLEELDKFVNKQMNNDDAQVPQLPEESAQLTN